jgi:hypothetical protein
VPIARPDLPLAEPEPADRPSPAGSLGAAVLALAVAGGVAVAARSGRVELLGALALVQALLIGLWLRLLRPPGPTVVGVLAGGLAVTADLLLYRQQTAELRTLAAVVAVAFPLALAGQLVRGVTREEVTAALAATMSLGVSMALVAGLLVAARLPGGRNVLVVAAAALGTAIAVARVVDLILPGPRFAPTVARGVPGLAAGALAGTAAGVAAAHVGGKISLMSGLGVGIAVAAVAVLADLAAGYLLVDRQGSRLGFALGPLLASAYAVAPAYALGWILLN